MFCPKCGTKLNEDMTCPNCGMKVHTDEKSSNHQKRVIRKLSEDEVKIGYPNEKIASGTTEDSYGQTETTDDVENMPLDEEYMEEVVPESHHEQYSDNYMDNYMDDENDIDLDAHLNSEPDDFDDDISDDDYDGTIDDTSAQEMYQREHKKTKKSKGYGVLIAAGIILIAVIIAIVVMIFFSWYRGRKLSSFEEACDAYAAAIQENDADYGEYSELYDQVMQALKDKDYSSFRELMNQMTTLTKKMQDAAGNLQSLEDIRTQYTNELDKYVITEEYQTTYDDLMNRLDTAISQHKEESVSDLKKEFESLKINLGTANQQLVQIKRNEINQLDISGVEDNVKSVLTDYETQVDAALEDGNYKEAVRILDSWFSFAQSAEQELRAKESEERERLESESRARESEEAVKQSEAAETAENTGGYILADSDKRYVTEDEVKALDAQKRRLARNEIYARHGRMFDDAEVQAYFDSQSWYQGLVQPQDFKESVFNEYEKANVNLIRSLE